MVPVAHIVTTAIPTERIAECVWAQIGGSMCGVGGGGCGLCERSDGFERFGLATSDDFGFDGAGEEYLQ